MLLQRFQIVKKQYCNIVKFGILAKIINFLKASLIVMFIASNYNISNYSIAFAASMIFATILNEGIRLSLIPTIQKEDIKRGLDGRNELINKFINSIFLVSVLIFIIQIIFAPNIIKFLNPGIKEENLITAVKLMRIGSPIVIFHFIRATCGGYLQSDNRFTAGAKSGVANALVYVVILFIFRDKLGLEGLMITSVIAVFAQAAVMLKALIKDDGYRFKFKLDFKDERIINIFKIMGLISLSLLVLNISSRLDQKFISSLNEDVSLQDAQKVFQTVKAIFIMGLVNTVFPLLTRNYSENKDEELRKNMKFYIYLILVVVLPIALMVFALSDKLISAYYTDLSKDVFIKLSGLLKIYSLGFISTILVLATTRMYYAINNFIKPIVLNIVYLVINYLFIMLTIDSLGIYSIMISNMLMTSIIVLYSILDINKKVDFINKDECRRNILIIIGSLITMLVLVYILKYALYNLFPVTNTVNIIAIIFISACGIILYFMSMRDSLKDMDRNNKKTKIKK